MKRTLRNLTLGLTLGAGIPGVLLYSAPVHAAAGAQAAKGGTPRTIDPRNPCHWSKTHIVWVPETRGCMTPAAYSQWLKERAK